jgi:hypothetical protein
MAAGKARGAAHSAEDAQADTQSLALACKEGSRGTAERRVTVAVIGRGSKSSNIATSGSWMRGTLVAVECFSDLAARLLKEGAGARRSESAM